MRNIPYSTLNPINKEQREEIFEKFTQVYDKGWFVLGDECRDFENEFSEYCRTKHCVGCGTGLDAIYLILRALEIGKGDEVIIPSNTFIATALAVSYTGAKPILVDPDPYTFVLGKKGVQEKITPRTKAIIAVHLYGQMADVEDLLVICNNYGLKLIEDSAQAHGATYKGNFSGYYGIAAAFSFYPSKNLGALGDGGAVVTNDDNLAKTIRLFRNYGSEKKYYHNVQGINSRLDEMQAAFLRIKLKYIDQQNIRRQQIAEFYLSGISNEKIKLPIIGRDRTHVWHIFSVLCDNKHGLKQHLLEYGIETAEHYPVPICRQTAYSDQIFSQVPISEQISSQQLSLPLFYGMTNEDVSYVIKIINKYK